MDLLFVLRVPFFLLLRPYAEIGEKHVIETI